MQLPRLPFTPEQASTVSGEVDALYTYLVAITLFFSVLVTVLIFYFAVKYRRRDANELPQPIAGSVKLETMWTVIPFLIAMTIFVWGASLYFTLYRPPKDAIEIFVVGKQWMWKFQHTEGQREINELHVPVGAKVKLTMTTEDVIHSFAVPAFRIRSDVVPGRYTFAWFEATKTGRYHLFCTEFCGTNHSGMNGWVEVMEPTAYQAWLAGGGSDSPAAQGEKLFQSLGCATCHRTDTQGRGPVLTGVFGKPQRVQGGQDVTVDEAYIRESIVNPTAKVVEGFQPIMPSYQGQVSEEQLLQLIAYIRSLGAPAAAGGATTTTNGQAGGGAQTTTTGIAPDAQRSNPLNSTSPRPGGAGGGGASQSGGNSNQMPGGGNSNR
ncbi:MAG: cytochrome c oxidase subunit [Pyrinomonadaceae bacterium]|jgi:cytochrome c oxidase subunit 2|nr:cytochrome c oxidase subunit [Pyrinomonadaceae bacterium]